MSKRHCQLYHAGRRRSRRIMVASGSNKGDGTLMIATALIGMNSLMQTGRNTYYNRPNECH
jgi:hypothetical protein